MLHRMSFAQVLAQANIIHKFYQMLHSHNNELLSALIWKHVQSHHWHYRFQSACDTKAIQQTSKKKLECKSNYKTKILAVVNLDILQSQQYISFIISLHRVGFRSFSFHFFFSFVCLRSVLPQVNLHGCLNYLHQPSCSLPSSLQ